MADQVNLATHPRVGTGKGEARALRREGRVPAIAYGAALEPTAVSVDARELYHVLHTEAGANAIIALDVDGSEHLTIAREVARHPVRRDILHVDFVAVSRTQRIDVDIPIHLEGEAPGAEEGGALNHELFTLRVSARALEVPNSFTVDIGELQIGDAVHAGDVALPDGVELLDDPERTVVSVVVPTEEPPEEPEEGAEVAEAEGATEEEAEAAAEGEGRDAGSAADSDEQ